MFMAWIRDNRSNEYPISMRIYVLTANVTSITLGLL